MTTLDVRDSLCDLNATCSKIKFAADEFLIKYFPKTNISTQDSKSVYEYPQNETAFEIMYDYTLKLERQINELRAKLDKEELNYE